MEILILTIILIFIVLYFYIKNKKNKLIKPSSVKKQEIIENYKQEMYLLLDKNKNNPSKQKEEKIKLIKKINQELSMNLFFDENESKEIISEILKIG